MEEKLSKALETLDVINAFVWESSARIVSKEKKSNQYLIEIKGFSDIEHQADIDGIENQVMDLKYKFTIVDGEKFMILDSSMSWEHDDNSNDSILIKGKLIVTHEPASNQVH